MNPVQVHTKRKTPDTGRKLIATPAGLKYGRKPGMALLAVQAGVLERAARDHYLECLSLLPAEYLGKYKKQDKQFVFFDSHGNQYQFPAMIDHGQLLRINPTTFQLAHPEPQGGLLDHL